MKQKPGPTQPETPPSTSSRTNRQYVAARTEPAQRYQPDPKNRPDNVQQRTTAKISSATPMSGLLHQTIRGMNSAGMIEQSLALAYWERAVGDQAAAASHAESVRDGILIVKTKSSVWSHELSMHKQRILLALNRLLGGNMIKDIIFRAQGVPQPEVPTPSDLPSAEELELVVLDSFELESVRAAQESLLSIPEERARRALARRILTDARIRHWRLERGWRECIRCTTLHKTEDLLCPICRLLP